MTAVKPRGFKASVTPSDLGGGFTFGTVARASATRTPAQIRIAKARELRAAKVTYARTLVGIHEVPDGSNDGPDVHRIQASTGAYREPWCVSLVQDANKHILGTTWAGDTANAYAYAAFAEAHDCTRAKPHPGFDVVYHLGAGHCGVVDTVNPDGTFYAIEGNEGNAVRHVLRDPRTLRCTFIVRPELQEK